MSKSEPIFSNMETMINENILLCLNENLRLFRFLSLRLNNIKGIYIAKETKQQF